MTTWGIIFVIHVEENDQAEQDRIRNMVIQNGLKKELVAGDPADNVKIALIESLPVPGQNMNAVTSISYFDKNEPGNWKQGKSFGKINVGNVSELTKVFQEAKQQMNANKYVVLTIDHGMGFGIFGNLPEDLIRLRLAERIMRFQESFKQSQNLFASDLVAENKSLLEEFPFEISTLPKTFRIENDVNVKAAEVVAIKIDMLTNTELSAALQDAFGQIEFLAMMNCYMQNADTIYSMRGAAKFLLAAETALYWDGFDYKGFINKLSANTEESDTVKVAGFLIDETGLREKYRRLDIEFQLSNISVTIVDLSFAERFTGLVKELVQLISKDELFLKIFRARVLCEDLTKQSKIHMIDMFYFLDNLSIMLVEVPAYDILYRKFIEVFNQLVKFRTTTFGSDLLNTNNVTRNYSPLSFSIVFPERTSSMQNNSFYRIFCTNEFGRMTPFITETGWSGFVESYIKLVEKIVYNKSTYTADYPVYRHRLSVG